MDAAVAVRSVMTKSPLTVDEDARLSDAVALMDDHHIQHLPIVHAGKLVGALSERNVRDAMPSVLTLRDPEARKKSLYLTRVGQVCERNPVTVSPDARVTAAIAEMRRTRCGILMVVEHGALVGVVTSGDLINLLDKLLNGG